MKMKALFGTQSRFTTPDKASALFVYDALNLFFSVTLSKHLNPLATSDGRPSSQVFGTFNRIRGHVKKYTKPGQRISLLIALDNEPKEKRELLPSYKMNRDGNQVMPEEERNERMSSYYTFLKTFPCTFVEAPGEEADDVIASVTQKYRKPTFIFSSDKDLWQLLNNPRVQQISLRESQKINDIDIMKKFDLSRKRSHMIALYKAVMGDVSDNIPKVPRMPTKAFHEAMKGVNYTEGKDDAVSLLLTSAAQLQKPRAYALLVENEQLIRRNLDIITLKKELDFSETHYSGSKEKMSDILNNYECNTILSAGHHEFLFR